MSKNGDVCVMVMTHPPQDLGVTGIQMGGVKRVENRFLYNQFNDKLEKILEQPSYCKALQQRSYKQFLDYLFLVWSPGT